MTNSFESWINGSYPGHHLWGIAHLNEYDISVEILPFERFSTLNNYWRVQKLLGLDQLLMRGLDQQFRALFRCRYDVIYSGCQNHTFLLAKLRNFGVLSKPVVAIIHHPIHQENVSKYFFTGHDRLICLSEKVRESLLANYDLDPEKVIKLDWGVDLEFYGKYCETSTDGAERLPAIISAGKSNRDHDTLVNSVIGLDCEVHIYCSEDTCPDIAPLPRNVFVTHGPKGTNAVSYPELLQIYKKAYVIAIPLTEADVLAGLTSLLDALAVGRPVIMTRNPYIDFDIEALGIGIWVDPGDVSGWKSAISRLVADPVMVLEMGRRARLFCEERLNVRQFSANLACIFKGL